MATLKSIKNKYLQASDGASLGVSDNADSVALLAFKMQAADSIAKFDMVDGFSDAYADATGIDASASTNETRNTAKYYSGGIAGDGTGGTVTTYSSGGNDYKVHSYTSAGNSHFSAPGGGDIDILVVAAGGGGAGADGNGAGGGGGGGGMRAITGQTITGSVHSIQVGDGGSGKGGDSLFTRGEVSSVTITNGGSSYTSTPTVAFAAPTSGVTATGTAVVSGNAVASITITNAGSGYSSAPTVTISGGGGSSAAGTAVLGGNLVLANGGGFGGANPGGSAAGVGGSGGGGGGSTPTAPGGAGNEGSFSPSEGNAGGPGSGGTGGPPCPNMSGGGGGGAGGGGSGASTAPVNQSTNGGPGGAGANNNFRTGSNILYAGGGGGGGFGSGGAAGSGGGGVGGARNSVNQDGTDGLGGGGGGNGHGSNTGQGGSGIIVIRYIEGAFTAYNDLTLVSNSATATAQPDTADIVATYTNGAGTATLNTDLKYHVSRDNGTTYTEATMVSQGVSGGHTLVSARNIDISGQPAGTTMRYKVTTHNQSASKETRAQAVSLAWA